MHGEYPVYLHLHQLVAATRVLKHVERDVRKTSHDYAWVGVSLFTARTYIYFSLNLLLDNFTSKRSAFMFVSHRHFGCSLPMLLDIDPLLSGVSGFKDLSVSVIPSTRTSAGRQDTSLLT